MTPTPSQFELDCRREVERLRSVGKLRIKCWVCGGTGDFGRINGKRNRCILCPGDGWTYNSV